MDKLALTAVVVVTILTVTFEASAQRMKEMRQGLGNQQSEIRRLRDSDDPRYRRHPSGGRPAVFDAKYGAQAASGAAWRITKDCASACTMGFGKFDKSKICIARGVKLGFHEGRDARSTQMMVRSYPFDVMALINAHGGIRPEWVWIPAREFHRIGYRAC